MRFKSAGQLRTEDRWAFFAYASQVMRSVIVNSVRERLAQKRGGGGQPLTLSTKLGINGVEDEETILRAHEALEVLGASRSAFGPSRSNALLRRLQQAGDC